MILKRISHTTQNEYYFPYFQKQGKGVLRLYKSRVKTQQRRIGIFEIKKKYIYLR